MGLPESSEGRLAGKVYMSEFDDVGMLARVQKCKH